MWIFVKLLAALTIYGVAVEPRFVDRNDEPAAIPNLPAAWEGKQVAVFSDLQVGMWLANTDAARRIVRRTVALKPAAVLIVGDFVYEHDDRIDQQMDRVLSILEPLIESGIPIYAVLGNHDYSLFNEHSKEENRVARQVRLKLDTAGVRVLNNRAVIVPLTRDSASWASRADTAPPHADSTGNALYLVGIGEKWAKNDLVEQSMAQVPAGAARLVFMHDPDTFIRIPAGQAPVAIAAHTHGMQIGVPYVSDRIWRRYFSETGTGVEGWQKNFGPAGNHLYINRGIGFSSIPARIHSVPELTVFTLTRAKEK